MLFEKYSGSGNDFLITHKIPFDSTNLNDLAKKVCNRYMGVGADGMILLQPHKKYSYEWIFFNSDGSEADACGNASRCVGHYAYRNKIATKNHVFLTKKGTIEVKIKSKNKVFVYLGKYGEIQTFDHKTSWADKLYLINTGVPHIVIFTNELSKLPKNTTQELRELRFQYNANINISFIKDLSTLKVHTYERGVEKITLACGTGMAACSIVANKHLGTKKTLICIPPSEEILKFSLDKQGIGFEGRVDYIAKCKISRSLLTSPS